MFFSGRKLWCWRWWKV